MLLQNELHNRKNFRIKGERYAMLPTLSQFRRVMCIEICILSIMNFYFSVFTPNIHLQLHYIIDLPLFIFVAIFILIWLVGWFKQAIFSALETTQSKFMLKIQQQPFFDQIVPVCIEQAFIYSAMQQYCHITCLDSTQIVHHVCINKSMFFFLSIWLT